MPSHSTGSSPVTRAGDAPGAESFWRLHVQRTIEILLRTHRIERVIDVLD